MTILRRIATFAVTATALLLAAVMLVPAALGYERYVIVSGSMTGTYDRGSIVFDKTVPTSALRVGDAITYAPPAGATPYDLVTHRIASIRTIRGQRVLQTKGDAVDHVDPWRFTLSNPRQARVAFSVPYVGYVISALADRHIRMIVIGIPAALIALMALVGVAREAREGRRLEPSV